MKNTLYFKTEEEKNQYFPDGVPSNILAVVGEEGVLYTSSNNRNMTGVSESQGGYVTDPADEARITYLEENKADKSELVGLATESYVTSKISDVVGAAPAALDTLNELASALNDDANFASYVATELAKKADSTDIPSLAGYATEAYVMGKGFLTEHQSLADYTTKAEVSAAGYLTSVPAGYATEAYVATYVGTYAPSTTIDEDLIPKTGLAYNIGSSSYMYNQIWGKYHWCSDSDGMYIGITNQTRCKFTSSAFSPTSNDNYKLGSSNYKFQSTYSTNVYASNTYCPTIWLNESKGNKITGTGNTQIKFVIQNSEEYLFDKEKICALNSPRNLGTPVYKWANAYLTNAYIYDGAYLPNNTYYYDGTSYTSLSYVLNEIQTNLGTAASVAELILGE